MIHSEMKPVALDLKTQADLAADFRRQIEENRRRQKEARSHGEVALRRLLPIAQGATGQSKRVALFLLALYNSYRFPFDMTNLRSLDAAILNDCLSVLRMDANAYQEVHLYFPNGGKVFEQLAKDWGIESTRREG